MSEESPRTRIVSTCSEAFSARDCLRRGEVYRAAALLAKRALDVGISGVGVVVVAPIIGIAAIAIKSAMGSPVLFRQERIGWHESKFDLLKLRTMKDCRDERGRPLSDEDRLTYVGRRIREWSVDELPQLLNVLRGEMSLVGPRPLLPEYLPHYNEVQAKRHAVRPGITGLAQVRGRNGLSWEEKFALDVKYVDEWSLRLDLAILALTLREIVRRNGISNPGHATMPRFDQLGRDLGGSRNMKVETTSRRKP